MTAPLSRRPAAPLTLLVLAFSCVYFVWGSTYLAILFAIETIPPLLMAGVRFVVAGAILYAWVAWRGGAIRPTAAQWVAALVFGSLFFLIGNGGVTWAETRIPSGIAAIFIAMIPFWITGLDAIRPGGERPRLLAFLGLLVGFSGVVLLLAPGRAAGESNLDPLGVVVLLVASFGWACGSVFARGKPHPPSILQTAAMQMLGGGVTLLIVGTFLGEWSKVDLTAVSARSVGAFLYLVLFGSIIAFSAYAWLLEHASPTRVGTYASINPIVAVFLGWAFGGEAVNPRTLIAGAIVVLGVVLTLRSRAGITAMAATPTPAGAKEPA